MGSRVEGKYVLSLQTDRLRDRHTYTIYQKSSLHGIKKANYIAQTKLNFFHNKTFDSW